MVLHLPAEMRNNSCPSDPVSGSEGQILRGG